MVVNNVQFRICLYLSSLGGEIDIIKDYEHKLFVTRLKKVCFLLS